LVWGTGDYLLTHGWLRSLGKLVDSYTDDPADVADALILAAMDIWDQVLKSVGYAAAFARS
jgi:hypothetical protein